MSDQPVIVIGAGIIGTAIGQLAAPLLQLLQTPVEQEVPQLEQWPWPRPWTHW